MELSPKETLTLAEVRELAFGVYLIGVARTVPVEPAVEEREALVALLREEFYREWEAIMEQAVHG